MIKRLPAVLLCAAMAVFAGCGGGSGSGSSTTTSSVPLPVIVTQPASLTVTAGQPASFKVGATGDTITYQWTKAGSAITDATAATYTIAAAGASDTSTYNVIVTNSGGSVTSAPATLTVVNIPPAVTTQPVAQSVAVGASVTLSVVASGSGTLTYQWRKGGVAIAGATSSSYTIASAAAGDAGSYDVVITNAVGSLGSNAVTVTVK